MRLIAPLLKRNAALVLILANQLGDMALLREALALARGTLVQGQKK
jgi:hypothetical protein